MGYTLKGIGDKLSGINEIVPTFDAKIFNFYSQISPGVIASETDKFPISLIDRGIVIGSGVIQAYGYFGMSDEPVTFNYVIPSSQTQYSKVYAEIDLSTRPQKMSINVTPQSNTTVIELQQDNIFEITTGVYQVPLYLITIKTDATITFEDLRPMIDRISYAKHSNNSDLAKNSLAVNNLPIKQDSNIIKVNNEVISRKEILYKGSFGVSSATSLTLNNTIQMGDLIRFEIDSEYPGSGRYYYHKVGEGGFVHLCSFYTWGGTMDYFYIKTCEVSGFSANSNTLSFTKPHCACLNIPSSGFVSVQFKNDEAIIIREIAKIIE